MTLPHFMYKVFQFTIKTQKYEKMWLKIITQLGKLFIEGVNTINAVPFVA